MMRLFFLLNLCVLSAPLHAGEFWSSLWRNADQRGEALMQQGDAASAAKEYSDPRRKAYAKLQAGDYTGAAEDLTPLHESEDDYNRGNALAHQGELQAALDAYDAALKSDPKHQDARHNRELVANALKNQPPQDKKGGDDKDKKNSEQKDPNKKDQQSDQGQDSTDQKKSQQGKDDQAKDGKQQGGNKPPEQAKNDPAKADPGKNGKAQDEQSQPGKAESKDAKGKEGQDKSAEKNPAQAAQKEAQERAKDDAEQARRELEASQTKPSAEGKKGEAGLAESPPPAKRKSEQQIAQEQWLRSIPDDPSGLLRRKFLIEHSMRHPKAQP
jgi:Ca-activated chloride channel family protein